MVEYWIEKRIAMRWTAESFVGLVQTSVGRRVGLSFLFLFLFRFLDIVAAVYTQYCWPGCMSRLKRRHTNKQSVVVGDGSRFKV
jgi:hypothetical protein